MLIKHNGNKNNLKKVIRLIEELEEHPQTGMGKPEILKGFDGTIYSRRLNYTDRIVYQVIEEEKNNQNHTIPQSLQRQIKTKQSKLQSELKGQFCVKH